MSGTAPAVADRPLDDDDIELTDAEREAMAEDEGDDAPEEAEEEAPAPVAKPEPAAAATPAAEPEQPAASAPPPVNVPLIRAEDTAAATARLEAIDTEADTLATRFDDGEMTAKEYGAAIKALEAERRDLDWSVRKAALSAEVEEQQATKAWFTSVSEFVATHTEIKPGTLRWNAFDTAVRMVTSDEANASLTNAKKLEKAYAMLTAEFGGGPAPAASKAAALPPRPALPPSLANIPASAVNNADDGRYANLDRLMDTDPMGYEAAMAKMSEADQAAYLAAR